MGARTGHEGSVRRDELEVRALGFTPLGSRLRPPQSPVPLVQRAALVRSLLADPRGFVLVSAPAGYGKSIALAQWAAADPRPSAWLQLDEADNDPVVFLTYLALALGSVAPLDPAVFKLLRLRRPPVQERILPAMAAALAEADPFLCVLDDGHLVTDDASWALIDTLLGPLPDGAQLALGTRVDPPLPLARLRAADRLAEYRLADLALDRRETRELFRLHDRELDDTALDDILSVTEGWAAGLRLALIAGGDRPNGEGRPAVRGDQRAIAAYLTEEVLELQPAALQHFMLRTSILDRLSPELCSAVTGDDDAGAHLSALAGASLFVTALDDHGEWFRYHHLFAELLATLEQRRRPGELPALHQRAGDWFEAHGDIERAARHWLAAGDAAAAAWPVYVAGFKLVARGQVESARRMLDSFTEQQLSEHLALTLAAGWLYGTVIGDPIKGERWRRAACTAPTSNEPFPSRESSLRAYQARLRAFLAPDGMTRMLADAELSLSLERERGPDAADAMRTLGVATYLCGRPGRAMHVFHDLLGTSAEAAARSYALGFLSLIAADEESWEDAVTLDREALDLTPTMTLDVSPGMYLAMPMLLAHLRVLAHTGDPEAATAIARAELYLGDMVPQVPWRVILIAVTLGEVQLSRGEFVDAERWTRRAEATLATAPDPGMLRGRATRLREALERLRMAEPVSPAERRVLELLPTQLTAEQIAARLFVTKNTVKSHMRSIYSKLQVTARTDAVDRARELGLIK